METLILRRDISAALTQEIAESVSRHESVLFVGPKYSGKQFACDQVINKLIDLGIACVTLQVSPFDMQRPRVGSQLKVLTKPNDLNFDPAQDDLFRKLHSYHAKNEMPVVVFVSGLDSLSKDRARRFLQEIRVASNVPNRWLSAVLTSESNILELVLGPKSEFTCARMYVLQAYARDLFAERFEHYRSRFDEVMSFKHHDTARSLLYSSSGGSVYILRQFFVSCCERRLVRGDSSTVSQSLSTREIEELLDILATPGLTECRSFRAIATKLEADVDSLLLLDQMFADDNILAKPGYPSRLELSGAVFNREGYLKFASPLLETFLRREFHHTRMGDLHALAGNWDHAFTLYNRPAHPSLKGRAHESHVRAEVLRRFRDALELSQRQRADTLFNGALAAVFGMDPSHDVVSGRAMQGKSPFLPLITDDEHGGLKSLTGVIDDDHYLVVRIPGDLPAWLVGELEMTIKSYCLVLSRLNAESEAQEREKLRHALALVTVAILKLSFDKKLQPSAIVQALVDLLRSMDSVEYAKAWLLSDRSDRSVLETFSSPADPSAQTLADMEGAFEVLTKSGTQMTEEEWSLIVPSESKNSSKRLLKLRNGEKFLGAIAIVFNKEDRWLQRFYGDFDEFSHQLEGILESVYSLSRAGLALHSISEPLLILDNRSNVDFMNASAKLLKLGNEGFSPELRLGLERARESQKRQVSFPGRLLDRPYEGTVVHEPLMDGKNILGVLIHVQPKSYYSDLLGASKALQQARDIDGALQALVQVFSVWGHEWIRVYKIAEDRLAPYLCVDPARPIVAERFPQVTLPRRDEGFTWMAINTGKPQVFSYHPEFLKGQRYTTKLGLVVHTDDSPAEAEMLQKSPGDLWIDFPLRDGDGYWGKLTVPCSEELSPERFQMFDVLAGLVSDTLVGVNKRPVSRADIEKVRSDLYELLGHVEILGALFEKCVGELQIGSYQTSQLSHAFKTGIARGRARIASLGAAG